MAINLISMEDIDLAGKRLLVREDLNVPMQAGKITSDARLKAAIPTLELAIAKGASTIVASHLGRPKEGVFDQSLSLKPVAKKLGALLGTEVPLLNHGEAQEVRPGQVALLENIRFLKGEKNNSEILAKQLAGLCDIFVMDAFGTAHRAHASTTGVAQFSAFACAGPLLLRELDALDKALRDPNRPLVAIVGGSKVSSKLEVIEALADKADSIIVGGGIANTFMAAAGIDIGNSLYEQELVETAKRIAAKVDIPLPKDVMVATSMDESEFSLLRQLAEIGKEEMVFDLGPVTARWLGEQLKEAGTILWNGPIGVFEKDQFGEGTRLIAEAIGQSSAYSIAGGGDTLAAIEKYGVTSQISYISTGGGAFLEFVEGKKLPAIAVLEARAAQ